MRILVLFICVLPLQIMAQRMEGLHIYTGVGTTLIDKVPSFDVQAKIVFPSRLGFSLYTCYTKEVTYSDPYIDVVSSGVYKGSLEEYNSNAFCTTLGAFYAFKHTPKRLFTFGLNMVWCTAATHTKAEFYDPFWYSSQPLFDRKTTEHIYALEGSISFSYKIVSRVYLNYGARMGSSFANYSSLSNHKVLEKVDKLLPGLGYGNTYFNLNLGVSVRLGPYAKSTEEAIDD